MKVIISNRGSSIIQVMIASSMILGLVAASSSYFNNANKGINRAKSHADIGLVSSLLSRFTEDPDLCLASFKDVVFDTAGANKADLIDLTKGTPFIAKSKDGGKVFYQEGQVVGGIRIAKLRTALHSLTPDTDGKFYATLIFQPEYIEANNSTQAPASYFILNLKTQDIGAAGSNKKQVISCAGSPISTGTSADLTAFTTNIRNQACIDVGGVWSSADNKCNLKAQSICGLIDGATFDASKNKCRMPASIVAETPANDYIKMSLVTGNANEDLIGQFGNWGPDCALARQQGGVGCLEEYRFNLEIGLANSKEVSRIDFWEIPGGNWNGQGASTASTFPSPFSGGAINSYALALFATVQSALYFNGFRDSGLGVWSAGVYTFKVAVQRWQAPLGAGNFLVRLTYKDGTKLEAHF